jgi:transcriptional regulator with XRE-family HTH domain
MKDRIKRYMDYKNISAGELATVLEVQRSNISHVLNGRNMPGAAFIEKFLVNFPDLNARWLLTGIGEMTSNIEVSAVNESVQPKATFPKNTDPMNEVAENNNKKPINKVVLLFSDGTFIDYTKK